MVGWVAKRPELLLWAVGRQNALRSVGIENALSGDERQFRVRNAYPEIKIKDSTPPKVGGL